MKTKKDIVDNWLPRYTGRELKDFSKYILLTNFEYYLELFSELYQVPIVGADKTMPNVSCNGITLVNFGMGSPNAATILDLLSAIEPEAVLFIGKCGGIKEKNSSHRCDKRRRNLRRLSASRSACPTGFQHSKSLFEGHHESWAGILYRRSLHDEPTGMGIRRSF